RLGAISFDKVPERYSARIAGSLAVRAAKVSGGWRDLALAGAGATALATQSTAAKLLIDAAVDAAYDRIFDPAPDAPRTRGSALVGPGELESEAEGLLDVVGGPVDVIAAGIRGKLPGLYRSALPRAIPDDPDVR